MCSNAHKVLGPIEQYCSCSPSSEPQKIESEGCSASSCDSTQQSLSKSECSTEASNPSTAVDSDVKQSHEAVTYSSQKPTNSITSQTLLDLKQSSSSREIDYSGPIITRALCTKRGNAQSCLFFRREELGTKFCDHPIACDPKIFHDPRIAIVRKSSGCLNKINSTK